VQIRGLGRFGETRHQVAINGWNCFSNHLVKLSLISALPHTHPPVSTLPSGVYTTLHHVNTLLSPFLVLSLLPRFESVSVTIVLVVHYVDNVSPFHKRSFTVVEDFMEEELILPIKGGQSRLVSSFYAGAAQALREGC
jgi:hypothetical protein